MHDYICGVLRDAEKVIRRYLLFLTECKDSDFWPDIPFWIDAVRSSQRICSIYYDHWFFEFSDRMLKRYRKIIAFDWRLAYSRYFALKSSFKKSMIDLDDDLPF